MHIILAPDSFKHSMTAPEICAYAEAAISEILPDSRITAIPLADGGEGTMDTLLASIGGRRVKHRVKGPLFDETEAAYGYLNDRTAVIEMASICGLTMISQPNPEQTTTFGVGQMIKKALDNGCRQLILCIGGSATNDAGIGMMTALGVKFLDANGEMLMPIGKNLSCIAAIDARGLDPRLDSLEVKIACDVNNPLFGENGAAYVFAPQKGASHSMIKRLDDGLRNFAKAAFKHSGKDIAYIPGSGAAGGIAAGLLTFAHASLLPGIDIVLEAVRFEERIHGADLIITGEGRTDAQTMGGKTVLGVARRGMKHNVPVIVISGAADIVSDDSLYAEGVRAVFSACRMTGRFDEIIDECPRWYQATVKNVVRTHFHMV